MELIVGGFIAFLKNWFPWLTALVLIVLFFSVSGRLSTTADTRVFLGKESSGVSELQRFEESFGRRSTLHFAVSENQNPTDELVPSDLLLDLEDKLWRLNYVSSVISVVSTNFPENAGDGVDVTPLYLLSPLKSLSRALDQASVDRILVTADRKWWSLVAEINLPVGVPGEVLNLDHQVSKLVSEVRDSHPGSDIQYTGELTLMAEFAKSAERDNELLVPLSLVVVLLLFAFSIRSWRVVLAMAMLLAMSISLSLALRALFGAPTNTATATIPLIILVVVAANAMHYFWALLYRAGVGHSNTKSLAIAVRDELALPLAISGFSTAGGFFLLLLASSPPFFEMGWVVGVTLIFSTLLILLWLPAALASFSLEKIGRNSSLVSDISSQFFLIGRNPRALGVCAATTMFALLGLMFVSINDDFTSNFPDDSAFSKSTRAVEGKFGGPDYLEIVQSLNADIKTPDPDKLVALSRDLALWLRSRDEVKSVVSLADSFDVLSDALGASDDVSFEELLLVYEMGLPVGQETAFRISDDRQRVRTTAMLGEIDSVGILKLKDELEKVWGDEAVVTGISIPTSAMAYENTKDVLLGVIFAGLFVALVMFFLHQSAVVAAVVFLFVGLPLAVGFGIWGWFFSDVGLATAAILAASVGIVVDDVVHVVYRYAIASKGATYRSEEVIVQIMKEVTPPIFVSSVAISIGFGLLWFSNFGVNQTLGLSISIIVLSALVSVVIFLPRVLNFALERRPVRVFDR